MLIRIQSRGLAQRLRLMETDIGVAVAVLNADNHTAYDGYGNPVPQEALVCHLRVVFPRLDELVVEIHVIGLSLHQPTRGDQGIDKQGVEPAGGVEVVSLDRKSTRLNVFPCEFLDCPEDGVSTAGTECGVKREVAHKMSGHILYARTATEVNAHEGTDDLAVLITVKSASQTKR